MPRFEHTVLALAVVCGFVFEWPHVVPVWAVLSVWSGLAPSSSPVGRVYTRWLAPRRRPEPAEDGGPWQAAAFTAAGLLGMATLLVVLGDRGVAWAFALVAAGLGALTGVGGVCVACRFYARRGEERA